MYDVLIIGLGPAGATLARLLKPGLKVAAIDRKDLNSGGNRNGFQKPCGGLLAPDAQKSLARFGLALPRRILASPQIFGVKSIDLNSRSSRYYQRAYVNLDRAAFDQWLVDLMPSRITVFDKASCRDIVEVDGGYEVHYQHDGQLKKIFARYVVGADGSRSLARRAAGDKPIRRFLCIQEWSPSLAVLSQPSFYTCFLDELSTDSYGWINIKDDWTVLGAALPMANGRASFENMKKKLMSFSYYFENTVKTEACLVSSPTSLRQLDFGKKGIFLIGEAAGLVSPSSLEGLSYAFDSAAALSLAFNAGGHPRGAYLKQVRRLRLKLLGKILKSPFIYHPFLRRLIMKSGFTALNIYS